MSSSSNASMTASASMTNKKVVLKKRGRPSKASKAEVSAVLDTTDESSASSIDEPIDDAGSSTDASSIADEPIAEPTLEQSAVIVKTKSGKKGSKYTDDEVQAVRLIIDGSNDEKKILTQYQLEIARWIETEDIKLLNIENKKNGSPIQKSAKASFCMTATFEKAYFMELVNQYKQPDGNDYTCDAFKSAIGAWFYDHINIGNSYGRSNGYLRTNAKGKVNGVKMDDAFFHTPNDGFLQGYLLTEKGKAQLEAGEEAMRVKRTTTTSAKGSNKTKEQRKRNATQATEAMDDDELMEQMARLTEMMNKRKKAKESESEAE